MCPPMSMNQLMMGGNRLILRNVIGAGERVSPLLMPQMRTAPFGTRRVVSHADIAGCHSRIVVPVGLWTRRHCLRKSEEPNQNPDQNDEGNHGNYKPQSRALHETEIFPVIAS
jgi:hypothetical protein